MEEKKEKKDEGIRVFFEMGGKMTSGTLVKRNEKTVWVQVTKKLEPFVIKRHIDKHSVSFE